MCGCCKAPGPSPRRCASPTEAAQAAEVSRCRSNRPATASKNRRRSSGRSIISSWRAPVEDVEPPPGPARHEPADRRRCRRCARRCRRRSSTGTCGGGRRRKRAHLAQRLVSQCRLGPAERQVRVAGGLAHHVGEHVSGRRSAGCSSKGAALTYALAPVPGAYRWPRAERAAGPRDAPSASGAQRGGHVDAPHRRGEGRRRDGEPCRAAP